MNWLTALFAGTDWSDARIKAWHLSLTLAAAYAAQNPDLTWAVPVLTMAASQSTAISGKANGVPH